jgi:peptidoglycan/xylan/chitin deacetylase (PgdA/CDA1 family)
MAASAIAGLRLSVPGLPVLLYHRIGSGDPAARDKYSLAVSDFRAQLELLRCQRYCTPHPQAIANPLHSERTVVITFDDGLESDYRVAFPLLLENGFTAAFFVNTAEIGRPDRLGWPQMREMQQAGMSFQSHGHHHVDYSRLDPRSAEEQLRLSREELEQNLGCRADCFSAPYGLLSRRLIAAAREAGFPFVFSSRNWPVRPGQTSGGRFAIYQNTALSEFRDLIGCAMLPLARRLLREAALLIPKQLLLRIRPQWLGVAVIEENP